MGFLKPDDSAGYWEHAACAWRGVQKKPAALADQNLNEMFNPPPASNWWYDGAVRLSEFLMS